MKKIFLLISLFTVKMLFSQVLEADIIFKNVNIITMKDDKVLQGKTVVVKNGKIIEINDKTEYKSAKIINTKGQYLMPTLADAHVHLPTEETEFERVMKLNLINGVTKIRSMRGEWKDASRKIKYQYEKEYLPKLYISPPPMHRSYDMNAEQFDEYVNAAKEYGFDFIKILSIKSPKDLKILDSICAKYNMQLGGHFPDEPKGTRFSDDEIFRKNLKSIEHLGGLIGELEKVENRIKKIKEFNVFITPTMQWYAIGYGQYDIPEMLNQRGMEYISSDIKNKWEKDTREYRGKLGKKGFEEEKNKYSKEMQERFVMTKRLNDERVKLLLSPDSSTKFIVPGFGMMEEMKLYQKAGVSNYDILRAATTNFALLFNENYGTIEVGKDADFLLLNQNPLQNINALGNIEAIYYNKTYLDKKQLAEIAKSTLPK